jgi:hypothetical protein
MYLLCGNNNPTFFFSLSFIPAKIPAKRAKMKKEEEKKEFEIIIIRRQKQHIYFY